MKAEIVREEMNRCGRAGIPFLFGVDFEGIHGFFVEKPLSDPSVLRSEPSVIIKRPFPLFRNLV